MEQRQLGRTDLKVSKICLGSMTWGEQNTESEAFAQIDAALDAGVNFVDTAEMYAVPATAKTYGTTETILGNWFRARPGARHKLVLASKVCGRDASDWLAHVRGGPRLNRAQIGEAIEGSLRRLQTDYLDLYQLHWPERSTNYFGKLGYKQREETDVTPMEETLSTLADLVKAGKVRHVGLSNETPWGAMRALALSQQHCWPRPVSIQNPYSLLNRSFEVGLAEVSHREQLGLLAYSPLAFGTLSGKYLNGAEPEGARITRWKRFGRYTNPEAQKATAAYVALARQHGWSPVELALGFVSEQPFVTSVIIGATSLTQLRENLAACGRALTPELRAGVEAIHVSQPNPAP
ncbi:MAG TPA: NADP(H)-dependent aldo-keto reductase [Polyangiales bacterium]